MSVKRCPKCGEEKELTEFCKNKTCKNGRAGMCKKCRNRLNVLSNGNRREMKHLFTGEEKRMSRQLSQKRYTENNVGRVRTSNLKHYYKNRDKYVGQRNKRTFDLTDGYIKGLLKARNTPITADLIELKRQQILMKRNLKQFKKWREEKEDESNHEYVSGEQQENEENYGRELQSRADSTGAARV